MKTWERLVALVVMGAAFAVAWGAGFGIGIWAHPGGLPPRSSVAVTYAVLPDAGDALAPEGGEGASEVPQAPDEAQALPSDPALRCAVKALRGDYGQLAAWQEKGYKAAILNGVTWRTIWATQYYPSEGFPRGQSCSTGYPVDERAAAANEIKPYSWVWTNSTGLRQVLDCGAKRNDRVARRKGADLWVDFWVPTVGAWGWTTTITDAAIIAPRA